MESGIVLGDVIPMIKEIYITKSLNNHHLGITPMVLNEKRRHGFSSVLYLVVRDGVFGWLDECGVARRLAINIRRSRFPGAVGIGLFCSLIVGMLGIKGDTVGEIKKICQTILLQITKYNSLVEDKL